MVEMFYGVHRCQTFFIDDTLLLLSFIKGSAGVCNDMAISL